MALPKYQDTAKHSECPVCGDPIRPIEEVTAPDSRAVHFFCLPKARADAARDDQSAA